MRTQMNNTRNLIQTAALAIMMLAVTNLASAQRTSRHQNHYRTDFIKQMVYQLSNEVMQRTGFLRYSRQESANEQKAVFASYTIPAASISTNCENENNCETLETELTNAFEVYRPAGMEESEYTASLNSELEYNLTVAAAPYDIKTLSFEDNSQPVNQELDNLLTEAMDIYSPAEYADINTVESSEDADYSELNNSICAAFQPYKPGDYTMDTNSDERINTNDTLEQTMIAAAGLPARF